MQAVVIEGGRLRWRERPDPVPGPDEIVVRVAAAGLNGADIMQAAGHYPPPPGVPADQPGLELAGVVEQVGGAVRSFVPGDAVMALMAGAAQAELAVVHAGHALAVPQGMTMQEAGGFPEAYCTAHDALFTQARLGMGERVLVTGAAGGVGTAAVQLAVAAGASVVASARDEGGHAALAALGAEPAAPAQALAMGPFDVVLELVGAPGLPGALGSLARWGRVVLIGASAGARCEIDVSVMMQRRAALRASTLRNRTLEEKAGVVQALGHHVLSLVSRGRVKVAVDATYPFDEPHDAYDHFSRGGKFGKVVLVAQGGRA